MLHGDADTTVRIADGLAAYQQAASPKAFITLRGVGHSLSLNGTILRDAPLGFFARYLAGDAGGIGDLRAAVSASPIASLQSSGL